MDEALVVTIARDLLRGLEYLHRHELAHRDLKVHSPQNGCCIGTLQGFMHPPCGSPEFHSKPPQVRRVCHFALLLMLKADLLRNQGHAVKWFLRDTDLKPRVPCLRRTTC